MKTRPSHIVGACLLLIVALVVALRNNKPETKQSQQLSIPSLLRPRPVETKKAEEKPKGELHIIETSVSMEYPKG